MHSAADITYKWGAGEAITFLLQKTGVITHEEHDRIVLDPGKYHKTNQVEYDPFNQTVSRVFD
jgi:hypothetical protein